MENESGMKKGDMIDPCDIVNDMLNDDLMDIWYDEILEPDYNRSSFPENMYEANKRFVEIAGVNITFNSTKIYRSFGHAYWYVWVIEDMDKFFLWKMGKWYE